jgi:hypothetical protein
MEIVYICWGNEYSSNFMKKTLYLLIILLPFTIFGQSKYWARLSIYGSFSNIGISPSEEIWIATRAGNVYYTKQIGELWHNGGLGSINSRPLKSHFSLY